MKKFSKILTLILAFAAILTAFTVVALAADPAPYTYSKTQAGKKLNFDGWTVEENISTKLNEDEVTTSFISIREDYPGGNKYMYIDGMGSKRGSASWYSQITYSRSTYKVSNYPIVALDFDVMTTNGRFGSTHDSTNFILRPYYYNDLVEETDTNYKKYVQFSSSSVGAAKAVSLGQIKLDNTAYLWQHVTIAYEWISGGTINTYVYVNGSKEPTYTHVDDVSASYIGKTSDINNSFFGVPYIMAASWGQKSQIRLDNYKQTYFPTGYSLSSVPTYIYNDSYVMPENYKYTVASLPDADGNITYFDDIGKAIEATGENDVLSLCSDINTPAVIDKAIKIDTNKYENGEIVGSYNFVYSSNEGFVAEIKDGIYEFTKSKQLVTVYWDPACDAPCNCYAEYGGHRLTAVSENVAKDAPLIFTGEIPTFKIENGIEKQFLGWSYTNDGTVDTLVPVTDEQIAAGVIYLYPVYGSTQYSFEVTTSGGTYYFLESQFTEAMTAVAAGGTVKLWTDVIVEKGHTFKTANANIVLDLNGHDYKRFSYYNRHYSATYNESEGKWVKGSRITTTTVNDKNETVTSNVDSGYAGSAFSISASGIKFTIKNSGAPAEIFTYSIYRDTWHDADGKIVGFDNLCETSKVGGNQNSGTVLFSYSGAKNTVITIDGNGITYYGACLLLNEWGGNQNTNTFNINGGTYYSLVDTYLALIAQLAGGYLNVNDAVIVTNQECFVRVADEIGSSTKYPITVADFRFTNCVIITSGTQNANTFLGDSAITLENCYYYNAERLNNDLTFNKGNYINASLTDFSLAEGVTQIAKTVEKSFKLIRETAFVLDENGYPTFKFTQEDKLFTFDYYVADIDTECVIVNWIDTEGYLLDSTYALKNEVVSIPYLKVPSGDGWRGVTNVTTWLDESGKVSNLLLGDKAEYDLFAVLPEEGDREYAATVTGAMFNMVYFTNFAYNVYVPKEAEVEITDFGGTVPTRTVWINNIEYWLYTVYAPSTKALDETVVSLTYKIDGASYTATFKPSAIYYANVIVNDPYASDDEKELVGCLIRYIEESYRALNGGSLGAANGIKLNSFYDVYRPAPYITEYPDADLFDSKPFEGLLYSVNLELESGKVKFVFTLTDEAVALNYSVKAKGLTGALYTEDGKVFTSDNTPLRTHVMEPFTILIVDKNGNTVTVDDGHGGKVEVSSQYSLAAYINGTNNNLCKALYAFGTALRVYYPVSADNYPVKKITLYGKDIKEFTIAADIDSPAEYYAAEQLQAYIYSKSGYWLEIVPSSKAAKSIVISLVEKTGGEGFEITFSENRINIVCEFSNLISSEIIDYFKSVFEIGTVNFTNENNLVKNIRDIYYSDFGAVGDGKTDDSEAIRATHVYANKYGHNVFADADAEYYIGPMLKTISVQTNVNWGNAKFIIDDSVIAATDEARTVRLFSVTSGISAVSYTPATSQTIRDINAAGGIDASTITKIDLGLGRPLMLQIFNANHKNYIREGANANSGADQQEMILVDRYGNIDPSTPFMFDYSEVTKITVYEIEVAPITVEGGIFTTIANQAPCEYTDYARNIQVSRPNTTVRNVTHYVIGEGETGAPYGAFLKAHTAYNVRFENCTVTGHKIYYKSGTTTGMGSYDIGSTSSVNVYWLNCTQTNFFSNEAKEQTTKNTHWGVMGSSYTKNMYVENSRITRVDAHAGILNLTIRNSELIHITVVGGGELTVEDTTIYNNKIVQLRTDYGNFWHGNVTLKNISMRNSDAVDVFNCTWKNHDFGYQTALPTNIYIDGITLKTKANINLFPSEFVTNSGNILKDSVNGAVNVNKMTPSEKITVKNTKDYTVVLPDKATYSYFANTQYITE